MTCLVTKHLKFYGRYHRFRWYATLENKKPAETFPKFPLVLRVIDQSDRNPPITATGCDWWISIRSVVNVYDWRKFWKRFRVCFVFQSCVSTKTLVSKLSHQSWKAFEFVDMFSIHKYCRNIKPVIPLFKDFRNEVIQMAAMHIICELCERYRINRSF